MQTINASEFKAKCLAILDQVARDGETVTILKRGKPVAHLIPPSLPGDQPPQWQLAGTVVYRGDLVAPVLAPEDWEAEQGRLE